MGCFPVVQKELNTHTTISLPHHPSISVINVEEEEGRKKKKKKKKKNKKKIRKRKKKHDVFQAKIQKGENRPQLPISSLSSLSLSLSPLLF